MAEEKTFLEDGDATIVEFTDEDGNKFYYEEEMIIPVDGESYALLVGLHDDDHEEGCACGCEDGDEDVLIAKIVKNEQGEDEYVEPTEDEFERVQAAYNALVDENEED